MEVEEDLEMGELCAEILENWNSPTDSDAHISLHHYPFSKHHHNVQRVAEKQDATYLETEISKSKLKYNDRKQNSVMEHRDNRILKALKPTNGKGSKCENTSEISNRNMGTERSILPVLVADTFFDKLLGHYSDGVDIAALSEVRETNASENEAKPSTFSANNGKRIEKLSSGQVPSLFKCNFPTVNRMPKRSPISGEQRRMPATNTEALVKSFRRSFFARYVLPSNKTIFDINIEDFGEKMWRNPGVNISDFFNYGLDEKQWKDYCKLMARQKRLRRFRCSNKTGDDSIQSLKDRMISEVKLDKENDECLCFRDSKDPSFYNSDVIIEIAMHESSYENEIRTQLIQENVVSTDDRVDNVLSNSRNAPYINFRMINGDKISPFPMDNYSAEEREWKTEQSQQHYDAHLTKLPRKRKSELLITHSEVELKGSSEMGKKQFSRNQGEYSLNHDCQISPRSARFYKGNQRSYYKMGL